MFLKTSASAITSTMTITVCIAISILGAYCGFGCWVFVLGLLGF